MKVRILGAAPGMPTPGLHHAAVAAQACGKRFLLDAGEGVSAQLMAAGLDGEALDFVAISHYHPDHVAGLPMLVQMLYLQRRSRPLPVYLPEREADMNALLDMMYTFSGRLGFSLEWLPMERLHEQQPFINAVPSAHLETYGAYIAQHGLANPMRAWSFVVEEAGKRFIYTADIPHFDGLAHWLTNADLLVTDALHPAAGAVLALAGRNIGKIVLTHGISSELQSAMQSSHRLETAHETTEYTV